MPFLQHRGNAAVVLRLFGHGLLKGRQTLRVLFHGGRGHILKLIQPHITLALYAEAGNAVPGDLRQQTAAHALNGKGKAGVLGGAFMAHAGQHPHKIRTFFGGKPIQQVINVRIGVAEFCGGRHNLFRLWCMSDQ